jgi:hypothetical protein
MPTGWSPTRLLSIRPGLEPNVPFVKLNEANEIPRDAEYMTLSHCWGKLPIKVLTTKNLKNMKNSISWNELPKTFQDAILIAKKLAIDYLWIDSLCIIQDSKDDWAKESMLMQHVYSNSFLNIAATSAPDGRSGCFFDRNTLAIKVCEFDISWEKDQKPKAVIMRAPDDFSGRCKLWLDNFMVEPLNRRAWVVQERVLSPRVLHFTSSQLVWECNERILCEKFPEQDTLRRPTISSLKEADLVGRSTKYKNHHLYFYRVWDEIVWAYSSSGLTNQSDKLVALAGVAQKMKEIMEDTYLWGLWRKKLEHGLIWCVMNPEKVTRPHPSVAPSWSWASVNGTVTHPTYQSPSPSFPCIEVIDIDSYGGEIDCSGYNHGGKLQVRCYLTTGIFFKSHKLFVVYSGPNEKTERLQFEIWCDVWPEKEEAEYFLVPVMLSPGGMQLHGIMLQKHEEETNFRRAGSFRVGDKYWPSTRMGCFTGSNRDGGDQRGFDIFWKSCYAYGAAHGNGIYDGVFEHKQGHSGGKYTRGDKVIQHTITII